MKVARTSSFRYLLIAVSILSWQFISAQCSPPGSGSGETCQDPISLCTGNIPVSTAGFLPDPPLTFCGGGATTENNSWVEFIAAASTVSFDFVLSFCQNNNGVQAVIFEAINGNCNNLVELACFNSGGTAQDFTVSANVTPGNVYLLMIDGYAGDQCDFQVTPSGVETNPAPPPVPVIDAPSIVCGPAASNVTLTVTNAQSGVDYVWYEPNWVNQNGSTITVDLSPYVGQTIQFCVEAAVPCVPECACVDIIVDIEPIVDIIPPLPITCTNTTVTIDASGSSSGSGFNFTWTANPGNFVSGVNTLMPVVDQPGTYTLTIVSDGGCETTESVVVTENTTVPTITLTGGEINCNTPTVNLTADVNPPDVQITWTGPNGFMGVGPSVTVDQPGTYTVTAVGQNGCEAMETITVEEDTAIPDASASGGLLNCYMPTLTLDGSSNTPGVTYQWTGPGGFTSNIPNPTVDQPGIYTFTVTAPNGCTEEIVVTVEGDLVDPDLLLNAPGITCDNPAVTIDASSATPGVTWNWTGPGGFSSNLEDPVIMQGGSYSVTVTNPVNGCTTESTIEVDENTTPPTISLDGGTLDCNNPTITINLNSSDPNVSYNWTGPNGFTSNTAPIIVDAPGTYAVTVTDQYGCESMSSIDIAQDIQPPNATASGGLINCYNQVITINGNSTTPGVFYEWTGPGGFISFQQNPSVTEPGTYTLTVTAPNGCTTEVDAVVNGDLDMPDVDIQSEDITCTQPSVTIDLTTFTPGVNFQWTGPGGFSSTLEDPTVNELGTYTVVVTNPVNGCFTIVDVFVNDTRQYPIVNALGNLITCDNPEAQLTANTFFPGVTYTWTGPSGFFSNEQNPTTTLPGTYTVTVTTPEGCETEQTVQVGIDNIPPVVFATGGMLTCQNDQVAIIANSSGSGLNFQWTGPNGFTSSEIAPVVSTPGIYTVEVTASNGCTGTAEAEVTQDADVPTADITGENITCTVSEVQLSGSSNDPSVSFSWTGPNGFTSNQQDPLVDEPGIYTLTVISSNGCTGTADFNVQDESIVPDITLEADTVSCLNSDPFIDFSSGVNNLTFNWTGPDGFTSTDEDPDIVVGGTYDVTVTSNGGCENTASITVPVDTLPPSLNLVADSITCQQDTVVLNAGSGGPINFYRWTGPGGFTSLQANPVVSQPGIYTLVVTGANGCTNTDSVEVFADNNLPVITAEADTLSCTQTSVQLSSTSNVTGGNYEWSGPNGFTATDQNPMASEPGIYTVTIIAPNGCRASTTVEVMIDDSIPEAIAEGDTLSCSRDTVMLEGSSNQTNVDFEWTGPGGFISTEQNPEIITGGLYVLTVYADNGCSSSDSITIQTDFVAPDVSANGDTITCQESEVTIFGQSGTPGATYSWTGPGGFTSTDQSPLVNTVGTYTLEVTGPNGCISTATAEVEIDDGVPVAEADGDDLSCIDPQTNLTGSSNISDVTFSWSGPSGFTSNEQNPLIMEPGMYTLTVQASNGCTSTATVVIGGDFEEPDIMATGDTITCANPNGQVSGQSTTSGATFSWSGPGGFTAAGSTANVTLAGTYTLEVTGPNGCTSTMDVVVEADENVPPVTAEGGLITCIDTEVQLQADIPNNIINLNWEGPNGFTSTEQNPIVDQPGEYTLIVEADNGCSNSDQAQVLENTDTPDVQALGGELTCQVEEISLQAISGTQGAQIMWSGPNGFTSTNANPLVSVPGTYTVTVLDPSNGCSDSEIAIVTLDTVAPTALDLTVLTPSCISDVGSIFINDVVGGHAPFEFSVDGGNTFLETPNLENLDPGTYNLLVRDGEGCEYEEQIDIPNITELEATVDPEIFIELGDSAQINVEVNIPESQIANIIWTPTDFLSCTDCLNPIANPDRAIKYKVTIIDINGCADEELVIVIPEFDPAIYIPNAFSPNNSDNINDLFYPFGSEEKILQINVFEVYDRWGELVHSGYDFQPNDPAYGWDGTLDGEPMNPAVFIYQVEVEYKNGEVRLYKGDVTLVN